MGWKDWSIFKVAQMQQKSCTHAHVSQVGSDISETTSQLVVLSSTRQILI